MVEETQMKGIVVLPLCSPMAAPLQVVLYGNQPHPEAKFLFLRSTGRCTNFQVHSSRRAPPGVDTRIHWENEDEGWIGATNTKHQQTHKPNNNMLQADDFPDFLTASLGSHYE